MSLELASDVGESLQHAVVYGGITGLWLTDSDDAQKGINVDTGLFSVAVSLKDGKLYLEGEGNWYENPNREGIYVDYCFALNPDAASDWGLLVPESATATLGLMALPGLAARRRRR